jgi:hypothetical protein
MAEFSLTDRFFKVALGCALPCAWWYFLPDYSKLVHVPLAELTIGDLVPLLFGLPVCLYATVSWFCEAVTGRDRVWPGILIDCARPDGTRLCEPASLAWDPQNLIELLKRKRPPTE